MAQTRAFVHSAKRRWAVAPDGSHDAFGNCCHVQPDLLGVERAQKQLQSVA
ncbi:hypothetical protein OG207_40265 [Streptomyces sp. NBC_01439]|nr:hypothetical protein [Streptomyces sp. NBC_01439]